METRIEGYSTRLLVPLPPYPDLIEKVREKARKCFTKEPLYYESDFFEGYAISWRSWYGFEDCLRYPSMRSFFPLRLKRIIDDWLDEDEDMSVIEWIDEERWEWLDVVKDYDEIFHSSYPHDIRIYGEFMSIGSGCKGRIEIKKYDFDELERMESLYSVFRVLARRGYWNLEGLLVTTRRDEFYDKIGFNFALPF